MSTPLDNFRTLASQSGTFQTLVGATGTDEQKAAAALLKVHRFGVKPRPSPPALYIRFDGMGRDRVSTSDYRCRGTINFKFELAKPGGASDWDDELGTVTEAMHGFLKDMTDLSISTGLIEFAEIEVDGPKRSGRTDPDEFWIVEGRARYPG